MSNLSTFPSHVPEEILLQIFLNLPIKSLGKCMCVCRAWNRLIKHPSFISSHLNNQSENFSRNNSNNLFLVMTGPLGRRQKVEYCLHFDDQEFSKYTHIHYDPFDTHHYIVGSCNGLLCLVDFQVSFISNFILYNPIIRKRVRLPKPCHSGLSYKVSIGFGFDSRRNDYKVLKITKKDVLDKYTEVELYSLKQNSWEILAPTRYDLYSDDFMVFVNGIVHWIASERVNDHGRIRCKYWLLGFDMGDGVFKKIMLPESLSNLHNQSQLSVIPYGELSSIAVIEEVAFRQECNIWVMKKYGVIETWTKMFSFGRIETRPIPKVLGFRKNGGLILLRTYTDKQVVLHEMVSNEKNLEIQGQYTYVFGYLESLVLLDQVIEAGSENGAKNESNASNSIKGAIDSFTGHADDSSEAEVQSQSKE